MAVRCWVDVDDSREVYETVCLCENGSSIVLAPSLGLTVFDLTLLTSTSPRRSGSCKISLKCLKRWEVCGLSWKVESPI